MSKQVKLVEITFENLDYVEIPAEYFGEFRISSIRTSVERLACNAILKRAWGDRINFELLQSVETALPELKQDLSFAPAENFSLIGRIVNRRDITSLDLHYEDGSTEQFYVPWEDARDEYHNKLLQTQINTPGNLFVTIQQN